MDESRFGLLSIPRRCLTVKGVKPIIAYQHRFQNFYLFGAYSTYNGDSFSLEMPYCNSDCFQQYLDELCAYKPQEFKILLLDNGRFHKAKELKIPPNIYLFFIPPYSPELNPAEMIWKYIKDKIANTVFETLDKLSDKLCDLIRQLNKSTIHSITGWKIYNGLI